MKQVEEVLAELASARMNFPAFRSQHEGYAIIKEELDELWRAIKDKNQRNTYHEAIQLCAMTLRFLVDYDQMMKQ